MSLFDWCIHLRLVSVNVQLKCRIYDLIAVWQAIVMLSFFLLLLVATAIASTAASTAVVLFPLLRWIAVDIRLVVACSSGRNKKEIVSAAAACPVLSSPHTHNERWPLEANICHSRSKKGYTARKFLLSRSTRQEGKKMYGVYMRVCVCARSLACSALCAVFVLALTKRCTRPTKTTKTTTASKRKEKADTLALTLSHRFFSLPLHSPLPPPLYTRTHRRIHGYCKLTDAHTVQETSKASRQGKTAHIQSTRLIRHLRFQSNFSTYWKRSNLSNIQRGNRAWKLRNDQEKNLSDRTRWFPSARIWKHPLFFL